MYDEGEAEMTKQPIANNLKEKKIGQEDSDSRRRRQFIRSSSFIVLCFLVAVVVVTIVYPLISWKSPLTLFQSTKVQSAIGNQAAVLAVTPSILPGSTIDLWMTDVQPIEITSLSAVTPKETNVNEVASITPAPTLALHRTASPSITPAPTAGAPQLPPTLSSSTYRPQPGSPLYLPVEQATIVPGACRDQLLIGQVFNIQSKPQEGLTIVVEGELSSKAFKRSAETGNSPQYGPAGYEIKLANQPISSTNALYVQVRSADGAPLSPQVPFDTFESCDKNLIVINFIQK